ncbi:MAG: ABC transporter ATP-binding protein [Spirochaetales bacterium]|nr:ABC transporter ATP-binding protein [Spirochaetales bacterium]
MFVLLKFLKNNLKPISWLLIIAIMTMFLVDIIAYMIPIGISYLTDHIYIKIHEPGMFHQLIIVCLVLIFAAFGRGFLAYGMIRCYWSAAETLVRELRNQVYEKLQHLDLAFYDRSRVGDLMSRVTTDIQLIRNFIAFGIEHRVRIIFITVTIFILMFIQEWRLALVVYGLMPLLYLIIIRFSIKMRKAVIEKQEQIGALAARIQENLTGIRIVKAFAMEEKEKIKFMSENYKMKKKEMTMGILQIHLNAILLITNGAGSLLILIYGGYQVIQGTMTLGVLMAFVAYLGLMRFPLSILAFNTSLINLAKGAGVRISEILDSPDQHRFNKGSLEEPINGHIVFKDVCFSYEHDKLILKDLNFTIAPGEKVALFGLTGAGKSTLISLIPRFYLPSSGNIEIDGHPIDKWELSYLRSQIGIVLQETFLFSTTIRENIAFGKPYANQIQIEEAAKNTQIHDFIMSLPDGYDTKIGEYGVGLSGGQRQRVAIARTLLQDPAILILDDCTSSLDALTEQKIQEQLKLLMKGRTTIIIAQRVSTLALAERIIVLQNGMIEDMDSHTGLLKRNQLYRTTYESQMIGSQSQMEDS